MQPLFSTVESEERSGMGFTVMESLYGQAAGEVRGRKRDCRDDDEISGSGQRPINMYRLLRGIHTN